MKQNINILLLSFLVNYHSLTYDVSVSNLKGDSWLDIVTSNSDDFNVYYLKVFYKEK